MSDPFSEFQVLLDELERQRSSQRAPAAAAARRSARAILARWLFRAFLLAAALVLPFWLLVGASVFLYRHYAVPTWPALLTGLLLTVLVLLLYASWVAKRISGKRRVPVNVTKALLAVVGAYCLYALIYLSSMNVKHEEVGREYRSLHPLLRVATSTFILVDSDLVITDMQRQAEDYERMGLPLYERSRHFVQDDGYAHAVDLRTVGRSEWRNLLLAAYFRAIGFRTLRHEGTADHLHVSLPMP
jgi:hypothetical protein